MKKEKKQFVDSLHTRSIWFNEPMGLWCTKVYMTEKDGDTCKKVLRRKTAKTKEKLYDLLYDFYSCSGSSFTMKDLFRRTLPQISGRRGTYTDKLLRAVAFSKGICAYEKDGSRNPLLADIHPHSLRVGAAGSLYQKTKNSKAVQYALGHRNPEMTEKYIKNLEVFDELKSAF